jgi:UDP-N-acetylglucosamine 2-epimerase (non-hydrolysing)
LVGADRYHILAVVDDVIRTGGKRGRIPEYWDGRAAPRIADHMAHWLASLNGAGANQ